MNDTTKHTYKPFPRGDHEITVRLCYDCDTWHADDDSLLYNEGQKDAWEAKVSSLESSLAEVKAELVEANNLLALTRNALTMSRQELGGLLEFKQELERRRVT